VDWVTDGKEAESLVLSESFDAHIFDVNVTGVDGIELLKRLRR